MDTANFNAHMSETKQAVDTAQTTTTTANIGGLSNNVLIRPPILAQLNTNSSTLSQALTKPPPLSAVLKSVSTAPNLITPTPPAFLSMPKNALNTISSSNPSTPLPNLPLIGSNLIAQTRKAAEQTNIPASNSNASSTNSSTQDLNNSLSGMPTKQNSQNFLSNSMPSSAASQYFSQQSQPQTLFLNKQLDLQQNQLSNKTNPSSAPITPSQAYFASLPNQQQPSLFQPQSNSQSALPLPQQQQLFGITNNKNQLSSSNNASIFPLNDSNSFQTVQTNLPSSLQQQQQQQQSSFYAKNFQPPPTATATTNFAQNQYSKQMPLLNTTSQLQPGPPLSGQQTGPPLPGQQPGLLLLGQQTGLPLPGQQPGPLLPGQKTGPPLPGQQPGLLLPGQQTGLPLPGQQPGPLLPGQQTGLPLPGQQTGPPLPGQQPGLLLSGQQTRPPLSFQATGPLLSNQQPQFFNQSFAGPPLTEPQQTPTSGFVGQTPSFFNNNQMNSASIRPPPTAAELASSKQQQQQSMPPLFNPSPNSFNTKLPPPTEQQLVDKFDNLGMSSPPSSFQQATIGKPINNSNSFPPNIGSSQVSSLSVKNGNILNRSQPHSIDLLREKRLIQEYGNSEEPPRPQFPHEFYTNVNCHHDTIRCTLTSIPESQTLLSKCRLPLGILIHPFKDLESLKVVQSSTIVRCRQCRSYINPFVHFLDNSKWRCNMCYSINDLPDEFLFDPVTRSYGDPSKRPEINSSTIEFIAPAEYTLRPPPPAMYLYLLDVSHNAISTGYLQSFCETLLENLDKIPGDSRTQIGFLTYNNSLHFYNLSESLSQPRMMIYPDIEDLVLPLPENLMVNLNENKESIQVFLQSLPNLFADSFETDSALGTALNAGFQLLKQTGGRITVMQTCLPNVGVGSLKVREENIDKDSSHLAPQTDFYKKLALDCAGVHIAVDLFMFNALYSDLSTLSCISKYSGGEIKYYPAYHSENHPEQVIRFCVDLKRYLIRKIGFEAVMRIRCTRGLTIHTFHGNFFVRSTDLLALPNVNPDAGFGMQVTIEENLTDITTVCFQAAVLYTSSKGERRIRIHTYCLPVSKNANEIINGADQEAIIGLVSKMAVDRSSMSSLKEAKDAMINVAIDYLQAYNQIVVSSHKQNTVLSPYSLRLLPLYILALMKNCAFRFGNIKMDDRVYQMNLFKTMPLKYLMLTIYPNLYAIHNLDDKNVIVDPSDTEICIPPRVHLSSENIDRHGVYIMDAGEAIYMWIGRSVSDQFLQLVFDCKSFHELPDHSNDLPELDNIMSERVRNFLVYLYDSRPFGPTFIYFREDSMKSQLFFQHMFDDKTESTISYYEFLRHLNEQISN